VWIACRDLHASEERRLPLTRGSGFCRQARDGSDARNESPGAGVGAVIFTAPSPVLESYRYLAQAEACATKNGAD
jgi:hypothetical protein